MNAAEIMSRDVIAIGPDAPLSQAVQLMLDAKVSGVPVLDPDGRPVGMLTEGDLLRRAETGTEGAAPGWLAVLFTPGRLAGQYIQTHGRRVAEIMTPDVIAVDEAASLADVVELMRRRRIKRVPVLRGEKIIGILSRADLMRVLAKALRAPMETPDDHEIRTRVETELDRQPWVHRRSVTVAVRNGVVLLDGCLFDVREREAVRILAENMPGVKRVENRLVCIEPVTGILILGPEEEQERQGAA
ncbi:MAG TPA: CBS domain-containing protein [Acetobacteraceae bacterium]|nr:CBS domain-containing protein [Acetobacteraceae bacterium]